MCIYWKQGRSTAKFGGYIMCNRSLLKFLSIAVLSFGLGVLLSFFIPEGVLVIVEALLIMAVGVLCFLQH